MSDIGYTFLFFTLVLAPSAFAAWIAFVASGGSAAVAVLGGLLGMGVLVLMFRGQQ